MARRRKEAKRSLLAAGKTYMYNVHVSMWELSGLVKGKRAGKGLWLKRQKENQAKS